MAEQTELTTVTAGNLNSGLSASPLFTHNIYPQLYHSHSCQLRCFTPQTVAKVTLIKLGCLIPPTGPGWSTRFTVAIEDWRGQTCLTGTFDASPTHKLVEVCKKQHKVKVFIHCHYWWVEIQNNTCHLNHNQLMHIPAKCCTCLVFNLYSVKKLTALKLETKRIICR